MKRKRLMLGCAILLTAVLALCLWYFRWQPLPELFSMDTTADGGFVQAGTWYPFTEDDRNTQYNIDVTEAGTEIFRELTTILDGISCRKSLFPNRNPSTVVGEPSVSVSYCRGERRIWLIFNHRFLHMGVFKDSVEKLYIVDPADVRVLSDYITENGYHMQTYLKEMEEASRPARTYLEKHSVEEQLEHFTKATYITGGFADVQEIPAYELFRFAVLVSEHGGMEWYDSTTQNYVIPVADIQSILDTYFVGCVFDPLALDRYATYDPASGLLTARAVGFSTGSARYQLVSATALTHDQIQVQLKDGNGGQQVTVTAKATVDGVQFVSCEKETLQSSSALQVEDPQLRQLFQAVLTNQADFFFIPTGEMRTLQELEDARKASMDEEDREFFRMFSHFTVCDLEQDGVPELIVQEDYYFFKILRYNDGRLSCYNVPYRGMMDLKTDGTFWFSSGYRDHGIGRAVFTESHRETEKIHWCQTDTMIDGNGNLVEKYECYVNGEAASEAELQEALAMFEDLENVCWYDYTEETVAQMFTPSREDG